MEKITMIGIEELRAYENNPRRISLQAVKAVAASIREFGFKVPIVIDEEKVIIAGHTRLLAARELGISEVPCIVANDLTPEQVKAFRLAENRTSELTNWDFEKLDIELEDIDVDMSDFGFEVGKMDITEFFEDARPKEPKHKEIVCPECGYTWPQ